jgi:hypothetical protein
MTQPPGLPVVTRAELVRQIEACLAGTLDTGALAGWAFDRFYAEELGEALFEHGAEELVADTLDALMFGDDPSFRMEQQDLRGLIARLGSV